VEEPRFDSFVCYRRNSFCQQTLYATKCMDSFLNFTRQALPLSFRCWWQFKNCFGYFFFCGMSYRRHLLFFILHFRYLQGIDHHRSTVISQVNHKTNHFHYLRNLRTHLHSYLELNTNAFLYKGYSFC